MQLDPARYVHYLDGYDLRPEERVRLVEQLWRFAVSAVDRAFGDAPEQIMLGKDGTKCPARSHDRLDSKEAITSTFNDAAEASRRKRAVHE